METGGELAKIRDENNDYSAPVYAGGWGAGGLKNAQSFIFGLTHCD